VDYFAKCFLSIALVVYHIKRAVGEYNLAIYAAKTNNNKYRGSGVQRGC